MATSKKRSQAAHAKRRTKRPAAKSATRATRARKKTAARKPVAKKASSRRSTAVGKRGKATGAAAKAKARKKVAAPKKKVPAGKPRKVAVGKPKKTAPRRVRPPVARAFFNPQAQLANLTTTRGARGMEGPTMPEGFFGAFTGAALTEQDYAEAAQMLGCEVAAVKAVAQVETAGASFDASQRPTILYECHVFARNTVPAGKFNGSNPDVSASAPYGPGKYGSRDEQYAKLAAAFQLDQEAALKAPSWGKFQILGENYKACGFASVADFVKAMTTSESEHLKAFVRFLLSNSKRAEAIRNKDWATFARLYNGPKFAQFKYDTKLAAAYEQFG